jgi:hypothetical protein
MQHAEKVGAGDTATIKNSAEKTRGEMPFASPSSRLAPIIASRVRSARLDAIRKINP